MWTSIAVAALLASAAVSAVAVPPQTPLHDAVTPRKLRGRFLHITDIHPDMHYVSGTKPKSKCHRGKGRAGWLGAEKSGCDSPWALANETFRWIDENLKNEIDFVVWTGDSVRHDNDHRIPRTKHEIYDQNQRTVDKMLEIFGSVDRTGGDSPAAIPVVPNIGNNDVFPHNIMVPGPSKFTKKFLRIWKHFVPSDQYHVFRRGGYFWQQVVPGRNGRTGSTSEGGLAVFSLNTLYFFESNKAVDGCDSKSEPGYEQMEWLDIQLSIMRERGMKAIIIGHVPPAWTNAKRTWVKSCWKKYVLWSRQYRDVIVGHLYGHMNLDHFMLLDSHKLKLPRKKGSGKSVFDPKHQIMPVLGQKSSDDMCLIEEFDPEADPEVSISSAGNYLQSLRKSFADVPTPGATTNNEDMEEYEKRIGGKWAERYVVANVGPSVVPNYFPTLRVFEYNITGLVDDDGTLLVSSGAESDPESEKKKKPKKKPRKGKKPKMPDPPAKTAPPGPAYSVQPYTFLSYTQYFLNITKYNAISPLADEDSGFRDELKKRDISGDRKEPRPKPQFEVEYDTGTESIYKLKDLTVRSYLKLARRIVDASSDGKKPKAGKDDAGDLADEDNDNTEQEEGHMETEGSGFDADKKKKPRKKPNPKADRVWHAFVRRAFVGTIDDTDLERFKVEREEECVQA